MGEPMDATPFLPAKPSAGLAAHRRSLQQCRGCDLYKHATQGVFGEGSITSRILFVGEQPGDQEDLQGHPFVGPAGKMLDRALAEIKLDRKEVFLTNAVKHFKWKPAPRGKRRLHARPGAREVHACLPWLQREIALVKPRVIVCLGATASQALLGGKFKLTENRGKLLRETGLASAVVVTTHPSAILRMPDSQSRRQAFKDFVADLKVAARQSRRPA